MQYTDNMQTKLGLHFHLRFGPEVTNFYDIMTMPGRPIDIVFDDVDQVHINFINMIEALLPGYIDEDEAEESYDYLIDVLENLEDDELHDSVMQVQHHGFVIGVKVCNNCVPSGSN